MHPRAAEIIALLGLEPHPEGGLFRRIFCSAQVVLRPNGDKRPALTSICYLMVDGSAGLWHRVGSDEAWHYYEGAPVVLSVGTPEAESLATWQLGPLSAQMRPVHVVPAWHWQQARTLGEYSLVGCSVGPGFDFADFEMVEDPLSSLVDLRRSQSPHQ
jgi:predicted cupin superfamily sugar epimerase